METYYPVERFSAEESKLLAPHVTNLDRPVFALQNLPETTKGMLFARYSRYAGTLRRMLLDEFRDSLTGEDSGRGFEGEHAAAVAGRVIGQFGDDSCMQLTGVSIACEWVSNVLTKVLQRPRIGAAYLEQSTRYIAFDEPMPGTGNYRYLHDSELGPGYQQDLDYLFETYSQLVELMSAHNAKRFPRADDEPEGAWRRAVRAKALDACRGLLPAASLSHMGIFASGQTFEQLILHLQAHPLPEAREYGRMLHGELKLVIPSFLAHIERPDRGGVWAQYLRQRRGRNLEVAQRLGLADRQREEIRPGVTLVEHRGEESDLLAGLIFEEQAVSELQAREAVAQLSEDERRRALAFLMGGRENRRHRPGRGLERLSYRFEVVSDYGAFRDLQRHRMLTAQWQPLTPDLGASVPDDVIAAGGESLYRSALERSAARYEQLRESVGALPASYALCLAYRIRYVLDLNAREAMQLIELRSGLQGHPSYRAIAQEMHRHIKAVHPAVAEAMVHVDLSTDPRLERIKAEMRSEARAAQRNQ